MHFNTLPSITPKIIHSWKKGTNNNFQNLLLITRKHYSLGTLFEEQLPPDPLNLWLTFRGIASEQSSQLVHPPRLGLITSLLFFLKKRKIIPAFQQLPATAVITFSVRAIFPTKQNSDAIGHKICSEVLSVWSGNLWDSQPSLLCVQKAKIDFMSVWKYYLPITPSFCKGRLCGMPIAVREACHDKYLPESCSVLRCWPKQHFIQSWMQRQIRESKCFYEANDSGDII